MKVYILKAGGLIQIEDIGDNFKIYGKWTIMKIPNIGTIHFDMAKDSYTHHSNKIFINEEPLLKELNAHLLALKAKRKEHKAAIKHIKQLKKDGLKSIANQKSELVKLKLFFDSSHSNRNKSLTYFYTLDINKLDLKWEEVKPVYHLGSYFVYCKYGVIKVNDVICTNLMYSTNLNKLKDKIQNMLDKLNKKTEDDFIPLKYYGLGSEIFANKNISKGVKNSIEFIRLSMIGEII